MRHSQVCRRTAVLSTTRCRTAILAVCPVRLTCVTAFFNANNGSYGLVRRTLGVDPTSFSKASQNLQSLTSLQCSRATMKSRSLAPDDPFGEKSSWEDPSDGLYSAWKDVDQEGFVNATQSEEVRNAHFGPQWARFTTVGRLSVKKMKEQALQPDPPPSSSPANGGSATTPPPLRDYPSAEEMHEAELKVKRRLLQRSYTSYEAFVEHELGAGGGFSEEATMAATAAVADGGAPLGDADPRIELHSTASMESAFSTVEGVDGRDRMAQRNVEREALDTMEAAEVEEMVPLPNFMFEEYSKQGGFPSTASAGGQAVSMPVMGRAEEKCSNSEGGAGEREVPSAESMPRHTSRLTAVSPTVARWPSQTSSVSVGAGVPSAIAHQMLRALGTPHGDPHIPLIDPINWDTEDIIHFITVMERRPADVEIHASRRTWSTMDETMNDTFRMAKVTGDTLLNVVVPPRLFRLMRRWHIRRQDVVNKAWKQYQESTGGSASPGAEVTKEVLEEVVTSVGVPNRIKLDEAVQPLDRLLIQETILLCFPYGR